MRYWVEFETPRGKQCVWSGWSLKSARRVAAAYRWPDSGTTVRIFKRSVWVEW